MFESIKFAFNQPMYINVEKNVYGMYVNEVLNSKTYQLKANKIFETLNIEFEGSRIEIKPLHFCESKKSTLYSAYTNLEVNEIAAVIRTRISRV